jgi:hypothetical protein
METPKYHRHSRWEVADSHAIKIMPRDLEYLYRLFIHGPLSSAMLHYLVSPAVRRKETTERFKIMRRKPNCLVEVPKQSREAHNANYQPLMYQITYAGSSLRRTHPRRSRTPPFHPPTELPHLSP